MRESRNAIVLLTEKCWQKRKDLFDTSLWGYFQIDKMNLPSGIIAGSLAACDAG